MKATVTMAARLDSVAAIDFYDSKPERRGDDVLADFDQVVSGIADAPRRHSLVEDSRPGFEARKGYTERFQQRVIFVIFGEEAFVITVVHADRRPGAWHRRLDTFQ